MTAVPYPAQSAPLPSQKCESGKNGEAGKFAACLHKARQKFVSGGEIDAPGYADAVASCAEKHSGKWQKLESSAGTGVCPSEGDESGVRDFVEACVLAVSDSLEGGALPPDPVACGTTIETCNGAVANCETDLASCLDDCAASVRPPLQTGQKTCFDTNGVALDCAGTGHDGDSQTGAHRSFNDNGDGTVTDNVTGLMWEKLSDDGSIHDKDNVYSWVDAMAVKIGTLNSGNFAGHADWRLPSITELQTLANFGTKYPAVYSEFNTNCAPACSALQCSCTKSVFLDYYWSSTSGVSQPAKAFALDFGNGNSGQIAKSSADVIVRAVRGGF